MLTKKKLDQKKCTKIEKKDKKKKEHVVFLILPYWLTDNMVEGFFCKKMQVTTPQKCEVCLKDILCDTNLIVFRGFFLCCLSYSINKYFTLF